MRNAPPPTVAPDGTPQRDWLVVARYDASRDVLTLSWTQDGDRHHRTRQGALSWPAQQLTDQVEGFQRIVEMLHLPRLF